VCKGRKRHFVTGVTFSFLRWFLCSFYVLCVLETIIQNNYTGLFARVRIGHESFAFSITDVSGRVRPTTLKSDIGWVWNSGPFAAWYEPRDPGVSAPGKHWIKSRFWPSGLTVELVELTSRPGGWNQVLTPAPVGPENPGSIAAWYKPRDPGVSVPANHGVKSYFWPSGPTVLASRITFEWYLPGTDF
jgi:hypothetical protein